MKERSPFTPGHPVPAEYFVGRQRELESLRRAIEQVSFGKNENIFLTGERGIGKSSLAALCKNFAVEQRKLLGAHCYLAGLARDVPSLCQLVIQRLLEENPGKTFFEKARGIIGRYIEEGGLELGLFGLSANIKFKRSPDELEDLPLNFLPILKGFYEALKQERKGLVIILDNLNGITSITGVALFLKSFIDELAGKIPLLLCLVGTQERMSDLVEEQPSVARAFKTIELTPMSDDECREFFERAFIKTGVVVQKDALNLMVQYSGGIPALLHEIGEATYWEDVDNIVNKQDAINGIKRASQEVGLKYFDRLVFEEVESAARRRLLLKVVKSTDRMLGPIRRKDVLQHLTPEEKRDFDNLLRRMVKLNVLKRPEQGVYIFLNNLFPVYLRLFLAPKIEKVINQKR